MSSRIHRDDHRVRRSSAAKRWPRTLGAAGLSLATLVASAGFVSSPTAAGPNASAAPADRLGYDFVVSDDGVYIWYNDERAVVKDRTLIAGFVQADGKTGISSVDLASGRRVSQNIELKDWNRPGTTTPSADDHNSPSVLAMKNGRIGVFYTAHPGGSEFARFSKNGFPTSIDDFGPEKVTSARGGVTYNNAYQLSGEGNKIFNFFRAGSFSYLQVLDPNGSPLGAPVQVISDPGPTGQWWLRPYLKVTSNGVDRIDLLYTNGHPTSGNLNMYHAYYKGGNLYKSDGTLIGNVLKNAPFSLSQLTKAYDKFADGDYPDGKVPSGKREWQPWNHEIKVDSNGNPVFVYSRQKDPYTLEYGYATYDPRAKKWTKTVVADAGDSLIPTDPIDPFTGKPAGLGAQPHYAGGIAINPQDVNEVFISANVNPITKQATPKFEIYRGVRSGGGFTWTAITQNSTESNYRPYVPSGARYSDQVVTWFTGKYDHFVNTTRRPDNHYYQGFDTKVVGRYLHRGVAQANDTYAIDFNGEHAITPGGYTPLDAWGNTPLVTDRATIKMVNPNGAREREGVNGKLLSDFGFAWRDLDVSISNLSPGYYRFALTNYDLKNEQNVAVQFFPTGSTPVTVVNSHSQTSKAPASFVAKVEANTDYTLRLKRLGTRATVLNSLEITPSGPTAPPIASFDPASDTEAAVGSTLSFDGSGSVDPDGGALKYEWRTTGKSGVVSTDKTYSRSFDKPGRYGVQLTVTDPEGKRAKQHINVYVATTLPSLPPVASFQPSSDVEVTAGTTMSFDGNASVDPDGGALRYEWRTTGKSGVVSKGKTYKRSFDKPGRYGVQLTVVDDEGQSATQHINVYVVAAAASAAAAPTTPAATDSATTEPATTSP